ncbi:extracellular solute-binding protein [Patescibacteria group bacterium]|nr:extracellular solute-binding protein [Patescibacteria group bacterium]
MRKKFIAIFLAISFVFVSGAACKITDKNLQEATKPITLNYWRVFDGEDNFKEIIEAYKAKHPHITINYRLLRYDEYEDEILNALAEDRGPDIFSIHNTWVKKYQTKLSPLPPTTTMVYPKVIGSIKKEVVNELITTNSISLKKLQDDFASVVYHDVVLDNKIYGLPLSVDTLAMYYNRDLLNNAGIIEIPKYWDNDFLIAINKLTRLDSRQGIVQSGVALGGAYNINRSTDILSLLMMQGGAVMQAENGSITFHQNIANDQNKNANPGLNALRFYSEFANPIKESYSWNEELDNSLDLFISGSLAIMFSYSYDLETIKTRAPKLNFSVTKIPQISSDASANINFANYWVEVVSNKSKYQNEAWHFIQFMTQAEQAKSYLAKTNKPAALKSLINQSNNDEINVFSSQILTAKSWYKGLNPQAAEVAMKEMILGVVNNPSAKIQDILNIGASRVQQTVK